MRMSRVMGVVVVLLGAAAAGPNPAAVGGQGVPPVLDPTSGAPGTVIAVTAPGCDSAGAGGISLVDAQGDQFGETVTFTTADTGSLVVPPPAPPGDYTVLYTCTTAAGADQAGSAPFVVTPPAPAAPVPAQPTLTG